MSGQSRSNRTVSSHTHFDGKGPPDGFGLSSICGNRSRRRPHRGVGDPVPKIVSDRLTYALGLTVTFGIGCEPRAPINDHAQVGEAPVQLVGAGIISTMAPEFATSLSPSGDTLFFNRTSADRSEIALLYSTRPGEAWGSPQPFGPTEGIWAIDPFMDETGTRLYFSSNLPLEGSPDGNLNLWFVERTGDEWSSPTALPRRINSDSSEVFNTFALDGTMVFSSTRNGVSVIYDSVRSDRGWLQPSHQSGWEPDRICTRWSRRAVRPLCLLPRRFGLERADPAPRVDQLAICRLRAGIRGGSVVLHVRAPRCRRPRGRICSAAWRHISHTAGRSRCALRAWCGSGRVFLRSVRDTGVPPDQQHRVLTG